MKQRIVLFSLFLLLGIGLFVGVILQTGVEEIWQNLRAFSLLHFGIFLFLSTLNFMLYTLRWSMILNAIDGKISSFWNLFLHRMSGFALSYLTPSAQTGGEPLRIFLLHQDGVSTKVASSSVIIDKGLELAALFLFIAGGFLFALLDGTVPMEMRSFSLVILVLFLALIFWFYYATVKRIGFFTSFLRLFRLHRFKKVQTFQEKVLEVEEEMAKFYHANWRVFFVLVLISLVITSFLLLEHWLIARFMGVELTLFQTFLASTIPYIAFLIPIPGGLGLLEGSHAAVFAALGISINAFVLVFIIRMRDLVFVLIGLLHASRQGVRMLKKSFSQHP